MKHILFIMLCLALCCCAGADPEQMLTQAEADLARGDIETVQSRCVVLADTTRTALTPEQMCRLAVVCGKLYDITKEQDYATIGAGLIYRATQGDSARFEAYFNTLAVEDQGVARMLSDLNSAINTPPGYAVDCIDESSESYDNESEEE